MTLNTKRNKRLFNKRRNLCCSPACYTTFTRNGNWTWWNKCFVCVEAVYDVGATGYREFRNWINSSVIPNWQPLPICTQYSWKQLSPRNSCAWVMSTAFTYNTWKNFSSKLPTAKQRKFLKNRGPQTLRFWGAASTFVRYEFFRFSAMGIFKKKPAVFWYNSTRRDNSPTHYPCLSKSIISVVRTPTFWM
jgi:hypothetical protein